MSGQTRLKAGVAFQAICAELPLAGGEPPEWVQLLPLGTFKGRDGRGPWSVADKAAAEEVVAASRDRAGSMDLLFDYDHQYDYGVKDGVARRAPASGWIKALEARDDGVWGRVEWTARAAEQIRAKEYRYLSPVFQHDKFGRVTRVLRAGLINAPNLDLAAVAAEQIPDNQETDDVTLRERLLGAASLPATATDDELVAAVTASAVAAGQMAKVRETAKAKPEDDVEAVLTALAGDRGGDPDPAKFVPIATYTAVCNELAGLKNAGAAETAETAVNQAVEKGLVLPASKGWALNYARSDLAGFKAYLGTLTPVVTAGQSADARTEPKRIEALTDEQKAVCAQMGWDEAVYLAELKKEAA